MADPLLHENANVLCSHGSSLSFTVTKASKRVKVSGQAVVTLADSNSVTGCPFQIPVVVGTKPQPCVRVQWTQAATRVLVGGKPALLRTSAGNCLSGEGIPQGAPGVANTQMRVKGI